MNEQNPLVERQERFDSLVNTIRAMDGESSQELMGSRNLHLELGKRAVRFSLFSPERELIAGYSPSILYQKLARETEHEGEYWAPISEVYLRRDKLDDDAADKKMSELDKVLNSLDELFDVRSEVSV